MKRIKLLIVDDNVQARTIMHNYYSRMEQIEVVGVAGNGTDAMILTRKFYPDIVVLDIIMSQNDGLSYLEDLRKLPGDKPGVIAVSALRDNCVERALNMGACFYMPKPFDYQALYHKILQLAHKRSLIGINPLISPNVPPCCESHEKIIGDRIGNLLLAIGIRPHVKGFRFLQEAVHMVVDNPQLIKRITKELYPTIAKEFGVTSAVVERTIRHAIQTAWRHGGADNINKIFGYSVYSPDEKPTNSECIALIAGKISEKSTT